MTHPILYLFLHSSTRFTLCSLFTFSLLFYYNYFDQRLFFLPFLPSFHFKLDLESTDDHFYKDIFSSFPIIHRGKRVISYFSQNDMTFSIAISLHLRLLHISHTVFLNQFTYLFFFFLPSVYFSLLLPKVYLYPRECFPSDVQRQWPRRRRRRRRDISVGVTIGVGAIISVVG